MNSRQRLFDAFDPIHPDRPPILGGWLAAPDHIQSLTGCPEDEYWTAREDWSLKAEQSLGSDGLIQIFVPVSRVEYRCIDRKVLEKRGAYALEDVVAEIEAMPAPEELVASFDEKAAYAAFVAEYAQRQAA